MALSDVLTSFKKDTILIGKIDRYLLSKNRSTGDYFPDGRFHPSEATSCSRALAYKQLGLIVENIKPKTRRIFDNGTYFHLRMQKYIQEMSKSKKYGIKSLACEKGVKTKLISARPDDVIKIIDGKEWVIDWKSINTRDFDMLIEPSKKYIWQIQLYMFVINIPRALIIYEDKNDQRLKEYKTELNEEMIKKIKKKFIKIKKKLKKGILPKRKCTSVGCSDARFCSVKEICFSDMQYNDIKKMVKKILKDRGLKWKKRKKKT